MVELSNREQTPEDRDGALHRWIEDEHVVERYLQHRLDAEAVERFEEHYLGCEDCVQRLELAERLTGALRGVALEDTVRAQVGLVSVVGRWLSQRPWLAAVPLLFLVVVGGLGWSLASERDRLVAELAELRIPRPVTATVLLDVVRSEDGLEPPPVTLTVGAERGQTLLALAVAEEAELQAELSRDGGAALWQTTGLRPTTDGLLYLALPSEFLQPGDYRLLLTPRDGDSEATPFTVRFRVAAEPPGVDGS